MTLYSYEHKGHEIEIHHDFDAPRPDWFLGTMTTDEPPSNSIWLPVYRYEHSSIAFSTKPFHCPWDSAQTGYIYVLKDEVEDLSRDEVLEVLRAEVEEFSKEVYGFEYVKQEAEACIQ